MRIAAENFTRTKPERETVQLEHGLFADIVIIFVAAFLGGAAARVLRLPVLLGYLAVGMVIGPHALRIVGNVDTVQTLAEFGVVLLLFAVGIEVSLRDLRRLGAPVALGGVAQVLATIGLVYLVAIVGLGWSALEALVLGMVLSLSSTMVVLKTLTDRGELRSLHGRVLTGLLLIQDLAFIPMIALLPALRGEGDTFLGDLWLGVFKAVAVLGTMALLGGKAVPWLLRRVAHLGSREVFILAVVAVTFATAAVTQAVGLSAALGAFVAGVLLSESDFGNRALSEVVPLRDTFSALFFVSLGMLTDAAFLLQNLGLVLLIVAMVVFIKSALTATLIRAFRFLPHTAILTGVGMTQVGEFSFILAASAASLGIVQDEFLMLTVVSAVSTMAMTPLMIAGGSWTLTRLGERVSFSGFYRPGNSSLMDQRPRLTDHVVICGLGRIGSLIAEALEEHGVPFVIIDLDPHVAARQRGRGNVVIHGASNSATVLEAARVRYAKLMVISTGDPISGWVTAQNALSMNPTLDIVARVHWREEGERLQRLGVREVVWPEMEAGLEMLRHSLSRYRTSRREVDNLVTSLRDHLSFGTTPEAQDVLPPEGLGQDSERRREGDEMP